MIKNFLKNLWNQYLYEVIDESILGIFSSICFHCYIIILIFQQNFIFATILIVAYKMLVLITKNGETIFNYYTKGLLLFSFLVVLLGETALLEFFSILMFVRGFFEYSKNHLNITQKIELNIYDIIVLLGFIYCFWGVLENPEFLKNMKAVSCAPSDENSIVFHTKFSAYERALIFGASVLGISKSIPFALRTVPLNGKIGVAIIAGSNLAFVGGAAIVFTSVIGGGAILTTHVVRESFDLVIETLKIPKHFGSSESLEIFRKVSLPSLKENALMDYGGIRFPEIRFPEKFLNVSSEKEKDVITSALSVIETFYPTE